MPTKMKPKEGKKVVPEAKKRRARKRSETFPIVGIGASAGGLEALDQFLHNVPASSGVAFVIVQHLDPNYKGMLPELLQRSTPLKVHQIKDRLPVEPDNVYVIPPNADIGILRGKFYVTKPPEPRGLRLPIDTFFRSLAKDGEERGIGVVLSGMGSDGTAGLRAIKEKAGLALVQEPASAKFDSMPRSAIDAGLADFVAPPEKLPGRILDYLRHSPLLTEQKPGLDAKSQNALEKIVLLLRGRTGHDFSLYKKSTLYRRIERRMGIHQLDRIAHYVRYLQENPAEMDLLFKELLIGVTRFFRDPEAWERLKSEILPQLLANRTEGEPFRMWVAGCSTGEEAYTLSMVFHEAFEERTSKVFSMLQIFATDIDREAVETARQGIYPASIAGEVSPERLNRFFQMDGENYRVGKTIREPVIFATHNLARDPPFTRLDLLSCRNLLIYLEPELQQKLLPLFHYSLKPGGVLFLGKAESIGRFTDRFDNLSPRDRLFRRSTEPMDVGTIDFPASFSHLPEGEHAAPPTGKVQPNVEALADKLVLQTHAPAAVLVTENGDILYATARTGKYLEPAVGKANLNIFAMAREGLRHELVESFQKVRRERGTASSRGLEIGTNGGTQVVDLTVQVLEDPMPLRGKILIVFADAPAPAEMEQAKIRAKKHSHGDPRIARLTRELRQAQEELQTTREEMQSSQEELKSANEELQSTNEELQSTNEELTTSREEMQSMNEELQTLNAELSSKLEELSNASSDMKNLLNSTDIATIFLDAALNVRRFTDRATSIVKLIPGDIGRPFTDLTSSLDYPEIAIDAREVLRTLLFSERQVRTRDGKRWYLVRILPYRTLEDRIDGVVITFADITVTKKLETELQKSHPPRE